MRLEKSQMKEGMTLQCEIEREEIEIAKSEEGGNAKVKERARREMKLEK